MGSPGFSVSLILGNMGKVVLCHSPFLENLSTFLAKLLIFVTDDASLMDILEHNLALHAWGVTFTPSFLKITPPPPHRKQHVPINEISLLATTGLL